MKYLLLFLTVSSIVQASQARTLSETLEGEACLTPTFWCDAVYPAPDQTPGKSCLCLTSYGFVEGIVACAGGQMAKPVERNILSRVGIAIFEGPFSGAAFAQVYCEPPQTSVPSADRDRQ